MPMQKKGKLKVVQYSLTIVMNEARAVPIDATAEEAEKVIHEHLEKDAAKGKYGPADALISLSVTLPLEQFEDSNGTHPKSTDPRTH